MKRGFYSYQKFDIILKYFQMMSEVQKNEIAVGNVYFSHPNNNLFPSKKLKTTLRLLELKLTNLKKQI